jgi:hypothetical protein
LAKAKPKENEVYIPIYSPDSFRKEILATAISSLEVLKLSENYIKEQKSKAVLQRKFKTIVNKINTLNNKLMKNYLPKIDGPKSLEKKLDIKEEQIKVEKPKPVRVATPRAPPKTPFDKEIDELKKMMSKI